MFERESDFNPIFPALQKVTRTPGEEMTRSDNFWSAIIRRAETSVAKHGPLRARLAAEVTPNQHGACAEEAPEEVL